MDTSYLKTSWNCPPARLPIATDEVHLWRAHLDRYTGPLDNLARLLSADEQLRAARFRFEQDRRRYTIRRAALRQILSRYVDLQPGELSFSYNPHGKPQLAGEHEADDWSFNVSHSQGLALYAIARGRTIGVDVERSDSHQDYQQIARHFFSPREVDLLRAATDERRSHRFLTLWTVKEAYLKATGQGLSVPLRQVEVSLVAGEHPQVAGRWTLRQFVPDENYLGALALDEGDCRLKCWQWEQP